MHCLDSGLVLNEYTSGVITRYNAVDTVLQR